VIWKFIERLFRGKKVKRISEVLAEFAALGKECTKARRKDLLLANDSEALRIVLQGAFHPAIKFCFRDPVTYRPLITVPGISYSTLAYELRDIYLFTENSAKRPKDLTYPRQRELLIQKLEAMEHGDAEVFMNLLLKDLKIPYLTYAFVKECYPDLLP
jgi:hypothetical protein